MQDSPIKKRYTQQLAASEDEEDEDFVAEEEDEEEEDGEDEEEDEGEEDHQRPRRMMVSESGEEDDEEYDLLEDLDQECANIREDRDDDMMDDIMDEEEMQTMLELINDAHEFVLPEPLMFNEEDEGAIEAKLTRQGRRKFAAEHPLLALTFPAPRVDTTQGVTEEQKQEITEQMQAMAQLLLQGTVVFKDKQDAMQFLDARVQTLEIATAGWETAPLEILNKSAGMEPFDTLAAMELHFGDAFQSSLKVGRKKGFLTRDLKIPQKQLLAWAILQTASDATPNWDLVTSLYFPVMPKLALLKRWWKNDDEPCLADARIRLHSKYTDWTDEEDYALFVAATRFSCDFEKIAHLEPALSNRVSSDLAFRYARLTRATLEPLKWNKPRVIREIAERPEHVQRFSLSAHIIPKDTDEFDEEDIDSSLSSSDEEADIADRGQNYEQAFGGGEAEDDQVMEEAAASGPVSKPWEKEEDEVLLRKFQNNLFDPRWKPDYNGLEDLANTLNRTIESVEVRIQEWMDQLSNRN